MTLQVEGTNDSSCLSKCSAAERGYFSDEFLKSFVNKCPRRAPLINLGYSVRAAIINKLIEEFVYRDGSSKQVVSFGAGFDTIFFKLFSKNPDLNIIYYELDLARVVQRKIKCIKKSDNLRQIIGGFLEYPEGLCSKNYMLLTVDLRDVLEVQNLFQKHSLNRNLPTLFLSECAITYLEEEKSTALITLASEFSIATFVTYEQIQPADAFGFVMLRHFASLQTPLMSVSRYPTLHHQVQRYISHNWEHCASISALEAYQRVTSADDRNRTLRLEPFDEWEEFYLKCIHYTVVIASKGLLCNWSKLTQDPPISYGLKTNNTIEWKLFESTWKARYGHSAVPYKEQLILIGGFGIRKNGTHGRLKDLAWLKLKESQWVITQETEDSESASMYTSWVPISDEKYVVYGGRCAPTNCVNQSPRLVTVDEDMSLNYKVVGESDMPARFRHSAVVSKIDNKEVLVVFGGRTSDLKILNDTWMIPLSISDTSVVWLPYQTTYPQPRFSHSAVVRHLTSGHDEMWVSGGLGDAGPLGDLWCLDLSSLVWRQLDVNSMVARFGHSASIHGSSLVLVGGVNSCGPCQPGVAVIDLVTGICVEYQLPDMSPEKSMLLVNHSHVVSTDNKNLWIVGGGGNCFSFGTFFNSHCAVISLESLNLK